MELLRVRRGNDRLHLIYTGTGAIGEVKKNKGLFFEHSMLEAMAALPYRRGLWLDVGANTGNHTVFMSRYTNADEIWAYEPHPLSHRILKANVGVWARRPVRTFNCAVGAQKGHAMFSDHFNSGINHIAADGVIEVPIETLQIDATVALIKIDVEGHEREVLKGAARTIERDKPELFIEHFGGPDSLLGLLPSGYRVVRRYNNAPTYHYSAT